MITKINDFGVIDLPYPISPHSHKVFKTEQGFVAVEFFNDFDITVQEAGFSYYSGDGYCRQTLTIYEPIDKTGINLPPFGNGDVEITGGKTLTVTMPRGTRFRVTISEPARQFLRLKIEGIILYSLIASAFAVFLYTRSPFLFLMIFGPTATYALLRMISLFLFLEYPISGYCLSSPSEKTVGAWKPHYFSVRREWFRREPQSEIRSSC